MYALQYLVSLVWVSLLSTLSAVRASSLEELTALANSGKNGIIELTDENFMDVLGNGGESTNRDYGIIALFTSHAPEFGCTTCVKFDPEFDTIAHSWVKTHPDYISHADRDKKLFFAKISIASPSSIPNVFKYFNLEQIPRLLLFSQGSSIRDARLLDIPHEEGIERVASVIGTIRAVTGIPDFKMYVPTDYVSMFVTLFTLVASMILIYRHMNIVSAIIKSRFVWAIGSVTFIVFMVSGYMFTQIRQVPLAGTSPKGEIIYFAENEFQNQFAIETQIVAVIYGLLISTLVFLVMIVPKFDSFYTNSTATKKNSSQKSKRASKKSNNGYSVVSYILAILGAILLYSFFAAYTNVYSMKQNYPFTLFKLTALFS